MNRIVGILGWLGVVLVLAAVALRFLTADQQQLSRTLALAGLAVTVLYALTQWRDIGRSVQSRNVKYGSIAITGTVIVLAMLVGVYWIAKRQNKRWDLTENQQFSVSDQTKQILTALDKPVVIRAFYVAEARGLLASLRDGLSDYAYYSKQVSVEYLDATRSPVLAQKYGIDRVPTIVLEYDGRTERATAVDEQTLTNALKKLVTGAPKKMYFVQGHGEHELSGSDPGAYSAVTEALKSDNFDVAPVVLAQAGKIPADATVLVIAGPRTDLLPAELEMLRGFMKRGGKLMVLVDPPDKGTGAPLTGLLAFAREWGIEIGNDLVIDASGRGQAFGGTPFDPAAMPLPHGITERFRLMTGFPFARSVTPIEGGTDGRIAQKFLQTSPESWAEADLKSAFDETTTPAPDLAKGDKAGPVSLAAAVSAPAPEAPAPATPDAPKPEARLVVVGDSDFASGKGIGLPGNKEIYLNMANWLAQQEDLIAIRPKDPESRPLTMTGDQGFYLMWFGLLGVPLLLFGNAVRIWWRKR